MKQTNFTKNFFTICCGVSLTILSVTALLYVVKPANAGQVNTQPIVPNVPEGGGGKYSMQYVVGQAQDGSFYWQVFVYNKETGNYKNYNWNNDAQDWKETFLGCKALPALP